jgi:DNA adenine methylase
MMNDLVRQLLGMHKDYEHDNLKTRETYVRAPMGWPGGKTRSLSNLLPRLRYSDVWVDVYGGSGIVTLARRPSKLDVYNDRYSGVVAFYRVLQDKVKLAALQERLEFTVFSREEFLYCKETWDKCYDDVERAARWFYMHQASFSKQERHFGRVRSGKSDAFGRIRGKIADFQYAHERFKNVQLENLDWRTALKDFDSSETTFYLDPPFIEYSPNKYVHELTIQDHDEILERIFDCKGFVAISGYEDPEYMKAPFDNVYSWEVYYSINGSGAVDEAEQQDTERKKVREFLYVKEAA